MKILQIMPAEGWVARYNDAHETYDEQLSCWALVEDKNGETRIVGMAAAGSICVEPCEGRSTFTTYLRKEDVEHIFACENIN